MAVSKKEFQKLLELTKKLPKLAKVRLLRELSTEKAPSKRILFPKKGRITKLGGLWKGIDITEEEIAEARREMWGNVGKLRD